MALEPYRSLPRALALRTRSFQSGSKASKGRSMRSPKRCSYSSAAYADSRRFRRYSSLEGAPERFTCSWCQASRFSGKVSLGMVLAYHPTEPSPNRECRCRAEAAANQPKRAAPSSGRLLKMSLPMVGPRGLPWGAFNSLFLSSAQIDQHVEIFQCGGISRNPASIGYLLE